MKLILASESPQRKKLLKKIGVPFSIIPSHIREMDPAKVHHKKARDLVIELAVKKAKAVAKKLKGKDCVILGADTLVICNDKILGKPKNEKHARMILRELSGKWQKVITGVCVIFNPKQIIKTGFEQTSLKFKKMDEKTIRALAKKSAGKSGAYAIQKMNDHFVEKMGGNLDNVIGLPMNLVKKLLSNHVSAGRNT